MIIGYGTRQGCWTILVRPSMSAPGLRESTPHFAERAPGAYYNRTRGQTDYQLGASSITTQNNTTVPRLNGPRTHYRLCCVNPALGPTRLGVRTFLQDHRLHRYTLLGTLPIIF